MQNTSRTVSTCFAAVALVLLNAGTVRAQDFEPLRTGDGVLFVGNSFTSFYGPLPKSVQAVYRAADPFLCAEFDMDNAGKACGILKEYVVLDSVSARVMGAIREARWKYVVLQTYKDAVDQYDVVPDESQACVGAPTGGYPHNQDTLIKYYRILDDSIKAVNAQTMLYSPHLLPTNYADNLAKVVECNERLMGEADVPYYVPVFRAWDSVLTDYPPDKWACPQQDAGGGVEMFYSDCQHQNPTGMALDAFTWYTVLTGGASAVGLQPRLPSGGVRQEPDTSLFNYLAGVGCEIGRRILVGMGYADDLQAPSPPTDLITSGKADSTIMLTWSPAADNVGVTHYEVLVDGVPYDTTTSTSMAISGVDMAEDRNLTVRAFDAAGHTSISSFPASTGSTVKYEAENNWWSYPDPDAVLQGFVSGYSGTGCIRVRTPGAMVSFRVYSPAAAVRPVDLRYNIYVWPEESMSRDISYYVNGDSIGEATLTTENRQRYYSFVENLPLEAGWNTVTYRFEGPEGEEINIDRISVEYDGAVGTHPGVTNGAHAAALQAVCVRPYSTARCAEMLLRSGGEQVARISVTDIAGHTLQRLSTRLARGNTIVRLSGAWLWNRLCLVTVETEAGRVTRRLLATR